MNKDRASSYFPWIISAVLLMTCTACGGLAPFPDTSSDYWEAESNDSSSQADEMPLNYSPESDGYDYTGVIASDDTSDDWYRLVTTQYGQLSVTLTCMDLAPNDHIYITLYDSALYELDTRSLSGTYGESVTASTVTDASPGVYFVRIDADSWTDRYDLAPDFRVGNTSFDYWEMESNNSTSQADEMPLNYRPASDGYDYTGVIASDDTSDDWYRLVTTQYDQLSVALTCMDLEFNEQIYITLYDSALNELDARTLSGSYGGSVTARTAFSASPGAYYVRIDADSWTHRYDLAPDFTR